MGRNLRDLAKDIRAEAKRYPLLASNLSVEGTKAMLHEMLVVTPVDTSEALSNWQVEIGSPPSAELPPHVMGSHGSTRGASSEQVLADALSALANKKPGESIFLVNTAGHIGDLDRGSSRQFPGGFVPRMRIIFSQSVQAAVKRQAK